MIREIFVKNMVCNRCIKVLKDELSQAGAKVIEIELGRIKLDLKDAIDRNKLDHILNENGFLLIDAPEQLLVEQVKIELIKLLQHLPLQLYENLSVYLENKMGQDYSKISKVFSYTEQVTVEKYFIKLKIEKVKELIQIQEYNFTEIGQLLDYSHINHLSSQFKNETGMSMSAYKSQYRSFRNSLDKIV